MKIKKLKKIDMPQLNIRLPQELKLRLEEKAFEDNKSVSATVIDMIEKMLGDQPITKQAKTQTFNAEIKVEPKIEFEIKKAIVSISKQLADISEKISDTD